MSDPPEDARLRAAIDVAIEAGRKAKGDLRRLESALVDAQAGEQGERVFWPFAVFRLFTRGSQRRRIMELTKFVQVELSALDAAVDVLGEYGAQLTARPVSRTPRAQAPRRARGASGAGTMWDGPLDLAQTTLQRVGATLDELRSLKSTDVDPSTTDC